MRDVVQRPGDYAASDDQHEPNEEADLDEGQHQHAGEPQPEAGSQRLESARIVAAAKHRGQRGQQHQREHHRQIFHDKPPDRDTPTLRLHEPAFLDGADEHHGACNREGKAKHKPCANGPSHDQGKTQPKERCSCYLNQCTRQGYRPDGKKIIQREM